MALQVGTLVVQLQARIESLERGLRRGLGAVQRFANTAQRRLGGVASTFLRLGRRITGFGALTAAALGAFSFVGIVRGAIDASSAVAGFRIRLQNLIGSQALAERTLANLSETATRVAPSLRDIIEAAATLGSVALGSSRRIEALTDTAINIAAVTGLTLEQSSQNLQRALSAGIGAADLFRERGVRAVVEALSGVPNLIDAPISTVDRAIQDVFGPNGTFRLAGEQFAVTLPGAISRARDAIFNFSRSLGDAISPAVIATLNEVFIPALNRLARIIEENQDEIADFARRGIIAGVRGLAFLAQTAISAVRGLLLIRGTLNEVTGAFLRFDRGTKVAAEALRLPDITGDRLRQIDELDEKIQSNQARASELAEEYRNVDTVLGGVEASITSFTAELDDLGRESVAQARAAAEEAGKALETIREQIALAQTTLDPRLQREVENATARLISLTEQRERAAARARSSTEAEIIGLERQRRILQEVLATQDQGVTRLRQVLEVRRQQLATLEAEGGTQEEIEFGLKRIEAVERDIAKEEDARRRATEATQRALAEIDSSLAEQRQFLADLPERTLRAGQALGTLLGQLADIDQEAADRIQRQLTEGLRRGLTAEELLQLLERLGLRTAEEIKKGLEDAALEFDETIGGVLASSIRGALTDFARNGTIDFAMTLGDLSASFLDAALENVLEDLGDSLNKLLERFDFGTAAGGAFGAALGVGAGLLAGALRSNEADVTNAAIQSAVDSAQQVRGIVAGPTDIPIFQVGNAIRDAFVETNRILVDQTRVLRDIRDRNGLSSLAGSPDGEPIGDIVNDEINSGPSLA